MDKTVFHRPTRFEAAYRRSIQRLIDKYFELPTFQTLGELNAKLVQFGQARNFISSLAMKLAQEMVNQVAVSNARSWRQAASKAGNSRQVHYMLAHDLSGATGERLDRFLAENARLITSVPHNVAAMLTRHIQTQQTAGLRSEAILKQIAPKLKKLKYYEIARIARTEVAKADTAITRVRAERLNLNWYQWATSEDGRVRLSHRKMDKVLINWNDPPPPEKLVGEKSEGYYHAGNIYNCRCVALPLVSIEEISFPVKIYQGGVIRRIGKREFLQLNGLQSQLAA